MTWGYDAHRNCLTTVTDGWRLLVQQGYRMRTWRAAVVSLDGGVARIAPAVFTSRIAAQAWCLAITCRERGEGMIGT